MSRSSSVRLSLPCSLIFLRTSSTRSARSSSRRGKREDGRLAERHRLASGRGRPDAVENRLQSPTEPPIKEPERQPTKVAGVCHARNIGSPAKASKTG